MSTVMEERAKRDEQRIEEANKEAERTTRRPERTVKEMAPGVKVVIKEDETTGRVQQTRIGGGWSK